MEAKTETRRFNAHFLEVDRYVIFGIKIYIFNSNDILPTTCTYTWRFEFSGLSRFSGIVFSVSVLQFDGTVDCLKIPRLGNSRIYLLRPLYYNTISHCLLKSNSKCKLVRTTTMSGSL